MGLRTVRTLIVASGAMLAIAAPAQAQTELEKGFAGALRGCEEWVLNPTSWQNGPGPFISAVGLGDSMGLVDSVEELVLPPAPLRRGNHYWRINSTDGAGYVLVVSDQLPMCHITGGGDTDLQPTVETVLATSAFQDRWEQIEHRTSGDMASTEFRHRERPSFSVLISRAQEAGQRLDHVQVIATATYDLSR